jgi:carbamate kinase
MGKPVGGWRRVVTMPAVEPVRVLATTESDRSAGGWRHMVVVVVVGGGGVGTRRQWRQRKLSKGSRC